jgi:hypothetical protein
MEAIEVRSKTDWSMAGGPSVRFPCAGKDP